jgi:hypothetical protein
VGGSTHVWANAGPLLELVANAANSTEINALSMGFLRAEAPVNGPAIKIKTKIAYLRRTHDP